MTLHQRACGGNNSELTQYLFLGQAVHHRPTISWCPFPSDLARDLHLADAEPREHHHALRLLHVSGVDEPRVRTHGRRLARVLGRVSHISENHCEDSNTIEFKKRQTDIM